jgi:hypothetical protein
LIQINEAVFGGSRISLGTNSFGRTANRLGSTDDNEQGRIFIRCDFPRACEEDLRRYPNNPVWQSYCPNAAKLIALTQLLARAVVM